MKMTNILSPKMYDAQIAYSTRVNLELRYSLNAAQAAIEG